jgi:peptidoglycan/xylan/chitin deacetylase (PgdA/CDA1 family)
VHGARNQPARGHLKRLAYVSGALGRYHEARNRNTLTVVMFHRVLGVDDERWAHADPRYTMTGEQLEQCIEFFGNHYTLVDIAAVQAAARREQALPARALLVTFDDGWADTEEYALPVLLRRRCPAVVFVVSSAVGASHGFWQERLFRVWKSGADPDVLAPAWRRASTETDPPPENWQSSESVRLLIARHRPLVPSARLALVEQLEGEMPTGRPELLTRDQLRALHRAGIEIGAHGVTHEALAETSSGVGELRESKSRLTELVGAPIETMSFPHGSYDAELLRAAAEAFKLVFTSDGCLNPVAGGRSATVLGRIEIPAEAIVGAAGDVRAELLALWLFRRSHATVAHL